MKKKKFFKRGTNPRLGLPSYSCFKLGQNWNWNWNLHPTLANFTKYNRGPYISDIKIISHLPQYLKALVHNPKHFRSTLKRFLYHHSFYFMEEYYEYKESTL